MTAALVLGCYGVGLAGFLALDPAGGLASVLPADAQQGRPDLFALAARLRRVNRVHLLVPGSGDPARDAAHRERLARVLRDAGDAVLAVGAGKALRGANGWVEVDLDPRSGELDSPFAVRALIDAAIRDAATGQLPAARPWGEAHLTAANIEAVVWDTIAGFAAIVLGALLLFRLLLGRVRALGVPLLAATGGASLSAGVLLLAGAGVHPMTLGYATGFSALLLDPAVYLLHELRAGGGQPRSWGDAMARIGRPAAAGLGVSLALFLVLALSGFPGLRHIGLFTLLTLASGAGLALLLTRAFGWFGVEPREPAGLGWLEQRLPAGQQALSRALARLPGPGRWLAALLAAALCLGGLILGSRVTVSDDVRRLAYEAEDLAEVRARLELARPGSTLRAAIAVHPELLSELRSYIRQAAYLSDAKDESIVFDSDDSGLRWAAVPVRLMREEVAGLVQRRLDAAPFTGRAYLLSGRLEATRIFSKFQVGLAGQLLLGTAASLLILVLAALSLRRGLAGFLPVGLGLGWSAAMHFLAGVPLNLVSLLGLTVVLGAAASYGAYSALARPGQAVRPARALATSGLATLLGYGVMIFARNGAVRGIGLATTVGLGIALLAALFLVPALLGTAPEEGR